MLSISIAAFALGLVFNAAPGPVFAATLRHGVRGGFRPAFAVQLGSLVGDGVWAVLGLAGVGLLAQLESLRIPIAVAGAAYLIWLAIDAWRASMQEFSLSVSAADDRSRTALQSGVLLSITNPQNIGYWAALGSALGAVGVSHPSGADYAAFFSGFMLSSMVWAVFLAAVVERTLGRAGVRWARITYRMCAILFLALALASLRDLWNGRTGSSAAQSVRKTLSRVPSPSGRGWPEGPGEGKNLSDMPFLPSFLPHPALRATFSRREKGSRPSFLGTMFPHPKHRT